jgi:hypothetical protein
VSIARVQRVSGERGRGYFGCRDRGRACERNLLVAIIATRGTATGNVTGITQTGATWVKGPEAVNAGGVTEEIWYAANVSAAGTTVTVNLAASNTCAVHIAEYSGIATSTPLDKSATNTGAYAAAPDTGTTAATTQADELWVAGLGHVFTGRGQPGPHPE